MSWAKNKLCMTKNYFLANSNPKSSLRCEAHAELSKQALLT